MAPEAVGSVSIERLPGDRAYISIFRNRHCCLLKRSFRSVSRITATVSINSREMRRPVENMSTLMMSQLALTARHIMHHTSKEPDKQAEIGNIMNHGHCLRTCLPTCPSPEGSRVNQRDQETIGYRDMNQRRENADSHTQHPPKTTTTTSLPENMHTPCKFPLGSKTMLRCASCSP